MNSEKLQQLKADIEQEFDECLNNSKLVDVLLQHGIEGHNVIQIQCMLDLNELQSSDYSVEQQSNELLPTTQSESLIPVALRGVCTSPICCCRICV